MMILCNRNFTRCCIYDERPLDFAVERQKSFSCKDPLFAGLFLAHALRLFTRRYSWIGEDFLRYKQSCFIFGFRSWWLCLAPAQIGTQGFTQPLCLDPLFVLCIFCQCHSPLGALSPCCAMPNGKPPCKPLDIEPQPSHSAAPLVLLL